MAVHLQNISSLLIVWAVFLSGKLYSQNYALYFPDDAEAHFEINHTNALSFTHAMTIECWVKPSSESRRSGGMGILGKTDDVGGGWKIMYWKSESRFLFIISDGKLEHQLPSRPAYPPGEYYHIAVTYNKAKGVIKLLVNGDKTELNDFTQGVITSDSPLYIGAINGTDRDSYFHGLLDEVRIWNLDREEESINQTAFSELKGDELGLVAYFNFNQAENCFLDAGQSVLLDASEVTNDGYFRNFDKPHPSSDGNLIFDGLDDHLSVPIANDIFRKNEITAECWVRPWDVSANERMAIMGKSYRSQAGGWGLIIEEGKPVFEIANGEGRIRISSSKAILPNQWNHIVVTYDRRTGYARLIVNGHITERNNEITGLIYAPPHPFEIGRYPINASPFFGEMREVRIWNKSKNPSRINGDKSGPSGDGEDGLVAHYKFWDHSSYGHKKQMRIVDQSEFNHDGWSRGYSLDQMERPLCEGLLQEDTPLNVWDVHQDKLGQLWLTTPTSLVRYDGIHYKRFNLPLTGDTESSSLNLVSETDGRLILESEDRLISFDMLKNQFSLLFNKSSDEKEYFLASGGQNEIWYVNKGKIEKNRIVGIAGNAGISPVKDSFTKEVGQVLEVQTGVNGTIWIGTDKGLFEFLPSSQRSQDNITDLRHFHPDTAKPFALLSSSVDVISPGQSGLWLAGKKIDGQRVIEYLDYVTEEFNALELDFSKVSVPGRSATGESVAIRGTMEERYGTVVENGSKNLSLYWPALNSVKDEKELNYDSVLNGVTAMIQDDFGTLWLATKQVILQVTSPLLPASQRIWIHDIQSTNRLFWDDFGMIWAATKHGLVKFHPAINRFNYFPLPRRSHWPDVSCGALLEDREGRTWIATADHDLFMYDPNVAAITYHEYDWINDQTSSPSITFQSLNDLHEDKRGRIWVASEWGLSYYDPIEERFYRFDRQSYANSGPGGIRFYRIVEDAEGLWFTHQAGIDYYNPTTGRFSHFFTDPTINPKDGKIKPVGGYPQRTKLEILMKDQKGRWWVNYGPLEILHEMLPALDQSQNLRIEFKEKLPVESNFRPDRVRDIFKDSEDRIWLGTSSDKGIFMFDPDSGLSKQYTTRDGLSENIVLSIAEDENGSIWFLTPSGLSKLDFNSKLFTNYDEQTGLSIPTYDRNTSRIFKTKGGEFLVSGINGFYRFHPDELIRPQKAPTVFIEGFWSDGQVQGSVDTTFLYGIPRDLKSIKIPHNSRNIEFRFSGIDLVNPEELRFEHRLVGLHSDWEDSGRSRSIHYSQLAPGRYVFKVRAKNKNGLNSLVAASLNLRVLPPWYKSTLANLIYFILFGAVMYALRAYDMKRIRLKQAFEMQLFQTQRLEELNLMKSSFYTNLSHEFRTPLTVIMGLSDEISKKPKNQLSNIARLIKRNGEAVLHLINQMLDLSKVESGTMSFNYIQGDVIQLLKYLAESFHSYAEANEISLLVNCELDEIVMDYDEEKMISLVSNLLSNAIKFTPSGGEVELLITQIKNDRSIINKSEVGDLLLLRISDSGIGIAETDLPRIFDRFFQVESTNTHNAVSTGLGLSLVKELVNKLGGSLRVESDLGIGSKFTVFLPITNNASLETSIKGWSSAADRISPFILAGHMRDEKQPALTFPKKGGQVKWSGQSTEEKPLLLIIEDSPDVIEYLKLCLQSEYLIVTAPNGVAGIQIAIEIVPSIIISDVMMPGKDGFEVCETLKNDLRTSHIPIVLLTARVAQSDRITGLTKGADAYLVKPFDKVELHVRMKQLVLLRQNLQQRYSDIEHPTESAGTAFILEDEFIIKIKKLVLDNLDNNLLGPDFLCKHLGMSSSQLYRKVGALTGKSVSLYIRSLRLHHAKKLLRSSHLNISEVAYEVGFANPSRLSEYFKETYGISPTQWRQMKAPN